MIGQLLIGVDCNYFGKFLYFSILFLLLHYNFMYRTTVLNEANVALTMKKNYLCEVISVRFG